jgi:flavodoxin
VIEKHFFVNAVLNQNGFQSQKYVGMEKKYGKDKVETYYLGSQRFFVIVYELKYGRKFNYFIAEDFKSIGAFKEQLKNSKADHILLGEPTETQLEIAKEYFPFVPHFAQPLNVNCYQLSKIGSKTYGREELLLDSSSLAFRGTWNYEFNNDRMKNGIYEVDSLNEFCFTVKNKLRNLIMREGNVILAKVKVKSKEALKDVSFNFSISNQKDSTLFFGGPEISEFYTDSAGYYAYSEIFVGSDWNKWIRQDAKITFFIWNRGKKKFSLSDLEIKTIDYWPERWNWWK